jgi:hypothetical protein
MPSSYNLEERRHWKRFPLRLRADCSFRKRRAPRAFPVRRTGEVQNLSVGGCCLLLPNPDFIDEGMSARLRIDWPAKIDGRVGLCFNVSGDVLRVEGRYVAVAIRHYHFRLEGKKPTVLWKSA